MLAEQEALVKEVASLKFEITQDGGCIGVLAHVVATKKAHREDFVYCEVIFSLQTKRS